MDIDIIKDIIKVIIKDITNNTNTNESSSDLNVKKAENEPFLNVMGVSKLLCL
jgi:hypothetical protein